MIEMAVELATAYISIVPSARGMAGNIAKELSGPAQQAGQQAGDEISQGIAKKTAPGVKTIVGAIGGAAAIGGAFNFLSGAIESASSLNETVSKAKTVFGPAAGDIESWASTAAKSIGQSRQQALDAAGSFGNMFVQLGIGQKQAADMSKEMTGLASDFASFHNADISQVLDAQQAAFRGEYDALQRFVPTINAAAVEQEALRATGKKTTKELTAQEKALAVQALMMKGAGDATGDFARTSDGLANKQRIQSAQWEDLKAKIGSGLLPVITKLTGFIVNTLAPGMEKLIRFISENKTLFVALGIGIAAVLIPAFIAWATAAGAAAAATLLAAAPVIAIGAAIALAALVIIKNWDTIKGAFSAAIDFVKGLIGGFIDFFKKVPGWIGGAIKGVKDLITAPFKAAFNAIAKLWNNTVGKLKFKIPGWVPGIGGKGFDVPNIPTFHDGGIVPGRPGSEIIARLQAGEMVVPTAKVGTAAGAQFGDINIDARGIEDPAAVGDYTSRLIGWRMSLAGGM